MSEARTHWFRRIMTYPIPIFAWGRKRHIDANAIIEGSALPAAGQEKIREVVRRTRLWRQEKSEVAEELVAHFDDGLKAGKTMEELLASFGEAKTAARLIRRGKKRNRPLWWQAQRRVVQMVGVVLLVYVGLGVLLMIRHPRPSVDYLAELNRPVLSVPVADRAWPIYREAWTKARFWELKDDVLYGEDKRGGCALRPGDAEWPVAAAFLREHRELLEVLRQAALKPTLGRELNVGPMSVEDQMAMNGTPGTPAQPPADRADELMSQSLITVLLPNLGPMRKSANFLAADMRLAASEGDAARVLANYRALTGMARQTAETPFLINELVALGIMARANQTLMEINAAAPQQLAGNRVALLHAMAAAEPRFVVDLSGERTFLLDTIQRVYSDDGHGDGSPTLDGLKVLAMMQPMASIANERSSGPLPALVLPAANLVMASRAELTEQVDLLYALAAQDLARPLWAKLRTPGKSDALVRSWKSSVPSTVHYALLTMLAPSLERAGIVFGRGRALHEASMVALALESYRDAQGGYPAALGALVPHYLPALPVDHSTGGPLCYKLVDGKPLLYGLGKDGADDGGAWREKKASWPSIPETGDWVLYPPVEDR